MSLVVRYYIFLNSMKVNEPAIKHNYETSFEIPRNLQPNT